MIEEKLFFSNRKAAAKERRRKRMKMLMSRRRRRSASSNESEKSDSSSSDDREIRRNESSDDDASEDEILDYLSGDSSEQTDDEEHKRFKQIQRDEKDKEAEGSFCLLMKLRKFFISFRFQSELAIKKALDEFMEKIKQSGASFHNAAEPTTSQTCFFSFSDLSAHLFAAFASSDCPSPLFLDYNAAAEDPYSSPFYNEEKLFRSNILGQKEIDVPPGFEHDSDALAAAEIEQKLAQFELEPIFDSSMNEQNQETPNEQ